MKFAWSLFERHAAATRLLMVSLVAVLLMALPKVYYALSETAQFLFHTPFAKLENELSNLQRVREKNRQLEEALMQALVQVNTLEQQKDENVRLRAQLGFEAPVSYKLIPLEALSVEYAAAPMEIQVNKGSVHGLAVGQPVVNQLGLLGRVEEVSARFARIQLLSNPGCRVAGRVAESREQGIVRYIPGKGLILDNLPIDGQLKRGDLVISSGLGGGFPAGLPLGVVESVVRDETEMFAQISLKPTVNLNAIDELYALVPDTAWGDED